MIMKKNLRSLLMMLVLLAGGNVIMAQWAQYHGNDLPEADASLNINEGATLVGGSSEIIADPDSASNNLWKYNVDTEAGDELKYTWYPSYWDMTPGAENTAVPSPSTIAVKFKWNDTSTVFGPDLEIREVSKVQARIQKTNGKFFVRVKDWGPDSSYALPSTFDPTEWHVLRLTSSAYDWSVYMDENPTALASGKLSREIGKHVVIFSAFAGNGKSEIMIDWMGYIESAASSPTDMPLPAGIFEQDPGTAVQDMNASQMLSVYPNPSSDMLSVSLGNDMLNSRYEMMDITGKIIQKGLFNEKVNQLDVSRFNTGMYFLRITSGDKVMSESFIVK
jgi:hypothetical protein